MMAFKLNSLNRQTCSSGNIGSVRVSEQQFTLISAGCELVNWLSQTRRNLRIGYLNLNIVTARKLTLLHSFYAEKVFVSCVWLITVSRVRTRASLFDTDILEKPFWI